MPSNVKLSRWGAIKGASWTIVTYGAGQSVRLVSSIALTRLLAPEVFGIMTLLNSLRTGADLFSDVGISQALIQNAKAEDPDFYNTAWSLKVLRGFILFIVCALGAAFFARVYESPIIGILLPVIALSFIFDGLSSISLFLMQRRLKIAEISLFAFAFEVIPGAALVTLAYFYRSIWSLVFGLLFASAVKMLVSHFLLNDVRVKFSISKNYMTQIMHFGKWMMLSSVIYFLSNYFDRLYLAKTIPLGLLGIYGIARSLSDMILQLVGRLCGYIVFPYIAASSAEPQQSVYRRLASPRLKLLLLAAAGLSTFAVVSDFPVKIIYDERYHAAGAMLPIMILGVWFSILCNINESIMLGFGRPKYAAIGNATKLGWLFVGMPFGFALYGMFGIIVVLAAGDALRYVPVYIGQKQMRFSFGWQDLVATLLMFGLFALFTYLRWFFGFGIPYNTIIGNM